MNNRELCWKLLVADCEEEVERVLKDAGYWNDPETWRPYGDLENNYGTIGNQQGEAVAALVEKIVNAIDARLMNECLLRGECPEASEAPGSIHEAVHRYFGAGGPFDPERSGRLSNWRDDKLNQEGDYITVTATGRRPETRRSSGSHPCLTISDRGEGQAPEDFSTTFLSLHKSNKVRINFVQGKFNMGATGALPYCSERHNFQLIISRRNPDLVDNDSDGRESEWGFTIVRRRDPVDNARSSVFEYLAPVRSQSSLYGEVLSFPSDTFPIFPSRAGQPYSRLSEYGSLIKLYEYRWQGTSSSIIMPGEGRSLIRRIELALAQPALPVKLYECRRYNANEVYRNARGILTDLERNRNDIEEGFPQSADLSIAGQHFRILTFVFKPGMYRSHLTNQHRVLFLYNGQTHASRPVRFFQRQNVKKSYLANDLLVVVDCSSIGRREFEDLFMNSRDRLRSDSLIANELEKKLEEFLLRDENLRSLDKQRRDAAISGKDSDGSREDLLKDILENNPEISRYLLEGVLPVKTGRGSRKNIKGVFQGKQFPTYFRPNRLVWNVGLGNKAQLQFQTDVENSYFTRTLSPGSWSLKEKNSGDWTNFWDRTGPNDGVARFYWDTGALPPGLVQIGNSFEFTLTIEDESRVEPLESTLQLNIIEPIENKGGGRRPRRHEGTSSVASPNVVPVYEEDWDSHPLGPLNNKTACRIAASDSGREGNEVWDFYVNVDNEYIHYFTHTKNYPLEAARQSFKTAIVILALSIIRGYSSQDDEGDAEMKELLPDYVARITDYIAPVLLPVIVSVGSKDERESPND